MFKQCLCWFFIGFLSACLCPAIFAEPAQYTLDSSRSTLEFKARSTLHRFAGKTRSLSGEMTLDLDRTALTTPSEVVVPVDSLETGIARRDQDMRSMFESKKYPTIRFFPQNITALPAVEGDPAGLTRYRLQGLLKIREIQQPVSFEVKALPRGRSLEIFGDALLTTTMFSLKPPSIGFIRVGKDVRVHFDSCWDRVS